MQLELDLWQELQRAIEVPEEADILCLMQKLSQTVQEVNQPQLQLQVAGEAIHRIVEVFHYQSLLAFEELECGYSDEGPIMLADAFDRYIRQSMELDLEQYIEAPIYAPRSPRQLQELPEDGSSLVGEVEDIAALLEVVDPVPLEEQFAAALQVAHEENVGEWIEEVATCLSWMQAEEVPFQALLQASGMPIVELWLALLLGDYRLDARGEFYSGDIWCWSPGSQLSLQGIDRYS